MTTSSLDPKVSYDSKLGLATFQGPGGFTQHVMTEGAARYIAAVLKVPFEKED